MARSEARIKTSIWNDHDFVALAPFSQWVYVVAVSQPTVSFCGVTPYTPRKWSNLAADVTVVQVRKAIKTLEAHDYVIVDESTEELWIRTFVKHDGVLTKPNIVVAMTRDFSSIQSQVIAERFIEGLGEPFMEGLPEDLKERLAEPFVERFRKRFPEPFPQPLAEPYRERPRARHAEPPASASSLHPPSPSPAGNGSVAAPITDPHPTSTTETENASKNNEHTTDPLVDLWFIDVLQIGAGQRRRPKVLMDAYRVIGHLRSTLDEAAIENRIRYCSTLEERPHSANYLLETCTQWAAERGLVVPPCPGSATAS